MGSYSKALEYHSKALTILENILGEYHTHTTNSYLNTGLTYIDMGNYTKAYQHYIDLLLLVSNHYLKEMLENNSTQEAISQSQTTTNNWLTYKGSILDSENRLLLLAKTSKDPSVIEKYTALVNAKRRYGQLNQSIPNTKEKRSQWKEKLKIQEEKITQLEQFIIKADPRFKDEKSLQAINSQDIANSLSKDALYIDFAKTNVGYYLFTIDHQNTVSFTAYSKEDSKAIDEKITAFQTKMQAIAKNTKLIGQPEDITKKTLGELYKLIFTKELLDKIADKKSLIISLDGALRLLPFEALFDAKSKEYFIETKVNDKTRDIRYIASGKELVRLFHQNKDKTTNNNKAVLFANPDFGGEPSKQSADGRGSDEIYTPNTHEGRTLSLLESLQPNFKSLPGTKREVDAIAKEIPHEKIKEGKDANEAYLLEVKQPKILHIATHGFFLKDIPNPMLKSGLILAGANLSLKQHKGDGIITALDLSGLDLEGTDLVVLSACETGKVDPNNTDGISGLTKAFIQAGAKDVVMSLWSVADDETASLMKSFYTESQKNNSQYAKALKQSKLELLYGNASHPYYWAAFVLSGL